MARVDILGGGAKQPQDNGNPDGALPLKNVGIPVVLLAWILISFFVNT
jgi:hypothetical protein